jgi:hypothetical protein
MRPSADWGTGPPVAVLEERRFLRYRRVVVPAGRVEWYRSLFEKQGLFRPGRSCAGGNVLSSRGRRTVIRFPDLLRADCNPSGNGQVPEIPGAGKAPGKPGCLVLKEERYPFPTFLHGILTVPRCEREFHNLLALRSLGFPAVEPLAFGHSGLGILYHRSFLITRDFSGSVNLKRWSRGEQNGISREEMEVALESFAASLARLHRARCYVRTLYDKNILVRKSPAGLLEFALCDVPRLWWFRGTALSFTLATGDLATMDKWARRVFSPSVRLSFLKAYLEALREGPASRRWVERILRKTERLRNKTLLSRIDRRFKKMLKKLHLENFWPF